MAEEFVSDFKERKKCIFRAKTLKSLIKPTSKAIFPNQVNLETPRDHDVLARHLQWEEMESGVCSWTKAFPRRVLGLSHSF